MLLKGIEEDGANDHLHAHEPLKQVLWLDGEQEETAKRDVVAGGQLRKQPAQGKEHPGINTVVQLEHNSELVTLLQHLLLPLDVVHLAMKVESQDVPQHGILGDAGLGEDGGGGQVPVHPHNASVHRGEGQEAVGPVEVLLIKDLVGVVLIILPAGATDVDLIHPGHDVHAIVTLTEAASEHPRHDAALRAAPEGLEGLALQVAVPPVAGHSRGRHPRHGPVTDHLQVLAPVLL
mmetsp:Transcript_32048/g.76470  ORF Transcript_32048/g.76470 Transcript_32048/m.76470 type:complete len:234 (+) Transcript_32048:829-1530(+)